MQVLIITLLPTLLSSHVWLLATRLDHGDGRKSHRCTETLSAAPFFSIKLGVSPDLAPLLPSSELEPTYCTEFSSPSLTELTGPYQTSSSTIRCLRCSPLMTTRPIQPHLLFITGESMLLLYQHPWVPPCSDMTLPSSVAR